MPSRTWRPSAVWRWPSGGPGGGTAPAILNGANEVAVERFLAGKIGFLQIPQVVEAALDTVPRAAALTLESIQAADQAARRAAARAAEG